MLKLIIFNNENFGFIAIKNLDVIENIPFNIKENGTSNFCFKFEIEQDNNSNRFYMKSLRNGKYLCSLPHDQSGYLECNRLTASDWESFTLEKEENVEESFSLTAYEINNLNDFYLYILEKYQTITYNDFLLSTANLKEKIFSPKSSRWRRKNILDLIIRNQVKRETIPFYLIILF